MKKKILSTMMEVFLIAGFVFVFLSFEYLSKIKLLAALLTPLMIYDIYLTWIPRAAISRAYCRKIKRICVVSNEVCYLRILTDEEKEFFISLCRKRAVDCDFYEEHMEDLSFEVHGETYDLLVFLSEEYPTYIFFKWKQLAVKGCFGVLLEPCELERLRKIADKFD